MNSVESFLAKDKRRIEVMAPDGNCIFRSIIDQVKGDPEDHLLYDMQAVLSMQKSLEGISSHSSVENWTAVLQHLKLMEKCSSWGTHLALKVMPFILNIPILVVMVSLYLANVGGQYFLPDNTANSQNHS